MFSRSRRACLCVIVAILLQPALTLPDETPPQIVFLHLRMEQDGSIRVLGSRTVAGRLKTPRHARGPLKLELQTEDSTAVWNGAVDDPRVRHFEFENPPGSGNLERRTHTVAEAEFMVRVPLRGSAAKLLVFEHEAPPRNAVGLPRRKLLLTHPLPGSGSRR